MGQAQAGEWLTEMETAVQLAVLGAIEMICSPNMSTRRRRLTPAASERVA